MSKTKLPVENQPWYLAELIRKGQTVRIDGNYYRILKVNADTPVSPCDCCNVEGNCKGNVFETCYCLRWDDKYRFGLWLVV